MSTSLGSLESLESQGSREFLSSLESLGPWSLWGPWCPWDPWSGVPLIISEVPEAPAGGVPGDWDPCDHKGSCDLWVPGKSGMRRKCIGVHGVHYAP